MIIRILRTEFSDKSAMGTLSIDGAYNCFTLEDHDRGLVDTMSLEEIEGIKVYAETCIPYGSYVVKRSRSPKFKKMTPELMDVPGFEGIRIHSANLASQLKGCIAPGLKKSKDTVWASRLAFDKIDALIAAAIEREEDVHIIIAKG